MSELIVYPSFPEATADYGEFRDTVKKIHRLAAPETPAEFVEGKNQFHGEDGNFHFPHPHDKEGVLEYAHSLAEDATDEQRSLIWPVAITGAHIWEEGNGRAARVAHALYAGKTSEEIAAMEIAGAKDPFAIDLSEGRKTINLQPPTELAPYIEEYVYKLGRRERKFDFRNVTEISPESMDDLRGPVARELSLEQWDDLTNAFRTRGAGEVTYLDHESIAYALSGPLLHSSTFNPEDFLHNFNQLSRKKRELFFDDLWQYRYLRALATVACVGNTSLASQVVTLPDREQPMSIADHYVRLTNNLVSQEQA